MPWLQEHLKSYDTTPLSWGRKASYLFRVIRIYTKHIHLTSLKSRLCNFDIIIRIDFSINRGVVAVRRKLYFLVTQLLPVS